MNKTAALAASGFALFLGGAIAAEAGTRVSIGSTVVAGPSAHRHYVRPQWPPPPLYCRHYPRKTHSHGRVYIIRSCGAHCRNYPYRDTDDRGRNHRSGEGRWKH